jgi:hypothetical protein
VGRAACARGAKSIDGRAIQAVRLLVRVWLHGREGDAMSVDVEELHTSVETEGTAPAAPSMAEAPGPDEQARAHRELVRRIARDVLRTRSEGYDD